MNQVKELQFTSNLVSCILRSAKGLFWEPQQHGGNDPYLSEYDEQVLVEMIIHSEEEYNPMGVLEVVDEAFKLKKRRYEDGSRFLSMVNSKDLSIKLQNEEIEPPSRPWVTFFSKKMDLKSENSEILMKNDYQIVQKIGFNIFMKNIKL